MRDFIRESGPEINMPKTGDPVLRKESGLIVGKGSNSNDEVLPDQMHSVMVGSPYWHAKIPRYSLTEARSKSFLH